ncbi:MAG: hypothetical protein NVS3B7_02340 [Candidatus Elarobacter sp.]
MNKTLGVLVSAILLASVAPASAMDNMKGMAMKPKCASGDPVVMADPKAKTYHMLSDKKSHAMMMKTGHKVTLVCKSKAEAMGAAMMKM